MEKDNRNPDRQASDERISSERPLAPPQIPPGAGTEPMERRLSKTRALPGVVENGLVRPLDPKARLTEHSRVVIVASDPR